MRTATPSESWHDCGTHRVRVVRRMVNRRRRYLATVFPSNAMRLATSWEGVDISQSPGRTVWGDYATPAEAVRAAETFISCTRDDTGERVCNWRDVEKVRAELAKGRQ